MIYGFNDRWLSIYRRNDLSLYMLINKHSVKDTSEFAHKIADLVQNALIDEDNQ